MASPAGHRPRHQGPRLVERPTLFPRTRNTIANLVALVWLASALVRLVRSHFEAASRRRDPGGARAAATRH